MSSGSGPTSYRVLLGRELASLRRDAGLDARTVWEQLGWSDAKFYKVEQGRAALKAAEIDDLLELYNADQATADHIRDIAAQARRRQSYGRVPDWSRQYLGLEQDATSLQFNYSELIPGLVQTERYARELISTSVTVAAAEVESAVEARMRRKAVLERPSPPKVHIILGEAALKRQVGGPEGLREQLNYLLDLAGRENVTIQLLSFTLGAHASLGIDFTRLDVNLGGEIAEWAYLEDLTRADCFIDRQHVHAYKLTWDSLVINALGERETLAAIKRSRDEI